METVTRLVPKAHRKPITSLTQTAHRTFSKSHPLQRIRYGLVGALMTSYTIEQYFRHVHSIGVNEALEKYLWNNNDNAAFYSKINNDGRLDKFAKLTGLDTGIDYKIAEAFLQIAYRDKPHMAILDVGAGTGRGVNYLLKNNYHNIHVLERDSGSIENLKSRFDGKITYHHTDLKDFKSDQRFDVIYWMWSGLPDFPKEQQAAMLLLLINHLAPQGTLVVDTPVRDVNNATESDGGTHHIKLADTPVYTAYVPTNQEIDDYAKQTKSHVTHYFYKTTTDRQRHLHFFQPIPTAKNKKRLLENTLPIEQVKLENTKSTVCSKF